MKKHALLLICSVFISLCSIFSQGFEHFITASGQKLMDGKNEFRFISFNIPNLNFVEDEMSFTTASPFRLPTEYEIRDAMLSVKQMGGQVIRIYTIPVKRSDQPDEVPAHVLAPGLFNEDAFRINDLMLSLANELKIRIIFPLLNNWKWMGGRPQYAAFRNKHENDFWTDRELIEDFKKTIEFTLNRTNTLTGIKYKDDKAILCWETGNELGNPSEWAAEITAYIKKLDKNHLVMDGYFAGGKRPVRTESVNDPSIDILSSHHYETNPDETIESIAKNIEIIGGKKPYVIGEFGFQSTAALDKIMNWMISEPAIAGGLIWSLRSHRQEGGFYWHSEPLGMGIYKAYHWPGFSSGSAYDEKDILRVMRDNAFSIQGVLATAVEKPASPVLLNIDKVYDINWQGSAGASFYHIERAEYPNGPWHRIACNISDAGLQYTPLYHDNNAEIGKSYYYRVIACNISGESEPSATFGPVRVNRQALIDDMNNYGKFYHSTGVVHETGEDRKYKEDMHRMAGVKGSRITYLVPGKFIKAKIYSFEKSESRSLMISGAAAKEHFFDIEYKTTGFIEKNSDYGTWRPVLYEISGTDKQIHFLEIEFSGEAKISRVEVIYE
ncbi:MAG: cellulase family glycosylhydrolase [Bacteroidales bacterium]|nr:cellulase family glycosylhydrolase [Bacteroidales bacterium]